MLTLDLDDCDNIFNKLNDIITFFQGVPNLRVFYRESCHKGHFHVKVYGVKNDYEVRWLLGDDSKRIELDKQREMENLPINILFSMKRYPDGEVKYAGEWKEWGAT